MSLFASVYTDVDNPATLYNMVDSFMILNPFVQLKDGSNFRADGKSMAREPGPKNPE